MKTFVYFLLKCCPVSSCLLSNYLWCDSLKTIYIACQSAPHSVKQILEVWNEQLRISIFGTFFGPNNCIVHLPFENINVNFSPNVGCFNSLIGTDGQFCCQRQIYEVQCYWNLNNSGRNSVERASKVNSSKSCHWQWNKENISSIQQSDGPVMTVKL